MEAAGEEGSATDKTSSQTSDGSVLMGVVRVGLFAKHIMLDGDLLAELVVICAEKPTTSLLRRVATLMATEILVTAHHSFKKQDSNLSSGALPFYRHFHTAY